MSTTFGIKITHTGEVIPVARRVGVGNGEVDVFFTNPLAEMLPNEIDVLAIDNSQQGINTIGDIKKAAWSKGVCPECNGAEIILIGIQNTTPCPNCYKPPKLD